MTITASEAKNKFGALLDEAQNQPVLVEKNHRPRAVLISYEDYQRLSALEDYYWLQRAAEAEKSGYLGTPEAMTRLQSRLASEE